jgi:para-nitrobenzyl esterase
MERVVRTAVWLVSCGVIVVCGSGTARSQSSPCFASTVYGSVQGLDRGGSCAFLGIPYAAPPIDALRWQVPHPPAAWAPATLMAGTAPPACAQLNANNGLPTGVEDCLMLNVWTPRPLPAFGAPVIVWIHGGSFVNSSANYAGQNGQNLAALTGTIVVAPNYRLGPFGFLGHSALALEGGTVGNYGLLDQRAALAWVRDNIAAFGGDPGNVTLAGQSAGAHSVGLHLVSPKSGGLFHRAITQSGSASFRWRTAAEAATQGTAFATALACSGLDEAATLGCLRSKSSTQVVLALPPPLVEQLAETGRTQWTPVVDGIEIPGQPRDLYEAGAFARVPTLLGVNRDEGWTFVNRTFSSTLTAEQYEAAVSQEFGPTANAILAAYPAATFATPKDALATLIGDAEYVCEARRVARALEWTRTPVYVYSFEREVDPVFLDRVVHGMEVNFVFGNNFGPPLFPNHTLVGDDLALSRDMSGYWARFAATGKPNIDEDSVVHWPAFKSRSGRGKGSEKYLVLTSPIVEGLRFGDERCDTWNPFFLRSISGAVPAFKP